MLRSTRLSSGTTGSSPDAGSARARIGAVEKTALVIGGTGQIGIAAVSALADAGYRVTAAHRGSTSLPGDARADTVVLDREDTKSLQAAALGHDVVVDTVAYTPAHAAQLAGLAGHVGSLVVISTGTVYVGTNGSSFETATDDDSYPEFPVPLTESSPTIDDGRQTYGALKAAMERSLLAVGGLPVSILRPGAVHGPRSPKLREFYFMKRAMDGRPHVVLSRNGESRFSTSSTANIAALVVACARRPGSRVLNATDEENYSVREQAQAVFEVMGHSAAILGFDGGAIGNLGATPWDAPRPYACSMQRARDEVGYIPALSYTEAVRADLEWLLGEFEAGRRWQDLFPSVVLRYGEHGWFPYDDEDRWVREVSAN